MPVYPENHKIHLKLANCVRGARLKVPGAQRRTDAFFLLLVVPTSSLIQSSLPVQNAVFSENHKMPVYPKKWEPRNTLKTGELCTRGQAKGTRHAKKNKLLFSTFGSSLFCTPLCLIHFVLLVGAAVRGLARGERTA